MKSIAILGNAVSDIRKKVDSVIFSEVNHVEFPEQTFEEHCSDEFLNHFDGFIFGNEVESFSWIIHAIRNGKGVAFPILNKFSQEQVKEIVELVNEIDVPCVHYNCFHLSQPFEWFHLGNPPKYLRIRFGTSNYSVDEAMALILEYVLKLNSNQIIAQSNQTVFHQQEISVINSRLKFSNAVITEVCAYSCNSDEFTIECTNNEAQLEVKSSSDTEKLFNLEFDIQLFLESVQSSTNKQSRIQDLVTAKELYASIIKSIV